MSDLICTNCQRPKEHRLSICICTYSDSEVGELIAICLKGIDAGADLGARLMQAEEEMALRAQYRSMPEAEFV